MDEQHNVNPNNIDPNQNNGNKHRDKKGASLWQIAIVAVVSA